MRPNRKEPAHLVRKDTKIYYGDHVLNNTFVGRTGPTLVKSGELRGPHRKRRLILSGLVSLVAEVARLS